jgi:quinol monooxygenase YgiN
MTAKQGAEEALKSLILRFYDRVRVAEPGCLMNIMHQGLAESRVPSGNGFSFPVSGRRSFVFYEVYADQQAAQAHPATPHFAEMVAELVTLIEGPVEVEFLDRIGGHEAA